MWAIIGVSIQLFCKVGMVKDLYKSYRKWKGGVGIIKLAILIS